MAMLAITPQAIAQAADTSEKGRRYLTSKAVPAFGF